MWRCKHCGSVQCFHSINDVDFDKNGVLIKNEFATVTCASCDSTEDTIQEIAEWVEEKRTRYIFSKEKYIEKEGMIAYEKI